MTKIVLSKNLEPLRASSQKRINDKMKRTLIESLLTGEGPLTSQEITDKINAARSSLNIKQNSIRLAKTPKAIRLVEEEEQL